MTSSSSSTATPKPPSIVVLGSIIMDLTAIAPALPTAGQTVVGERFYTAPGGKGANQAVAAARLGADVRIVGRVGRDAFGVALLDGLRDHRIDVRGVAEDPHNASGIAVILLNAQRQNHIVAVYGANAACDDAQLEATRDALHGADALLLQLETPAELSLAVAGIARERGVRVIWDPAPAQEAPSNIHAAADVLTPNQGEAAELTGVEVTGVESAKEAARRLLERGTPTVVVKLGELGVFYASVDESRYVPAFEVEVVDTVAAGDAFGAALAVALVEGKSLRDAVEFGAAAGGLAVTKPGAQAAMPARREVERLLAGS